MKYFIVCNNTPRGIFQAASGPGLRAHQLYTQITAAGHDVEYLMFSERYSQQSAGNDLFCTHKSLRLIPIGSFRNFVNQITTSTFIFTQANFVNQMKAASARHRIVFDFIGRKDLEFAEGGNRNNAVNYLASEKEYIDASDVVLTTSPKLSAHIESKYQLKPEYNPFSFSSKNFKKFARPTIVFGGRIQKWTNYANSFECIANYFIDNPEHAGLFMYTRDINNISDVHAKSVGRLLVMPNITVLGLLPIRQVEELVGKADLFVDCSEKNAERSFATSIRITHAIACGTPVIHNADTGLDGIFKDFPGKLQLDLDVDALSHTLEQAMDGRYAQSLSNAQTAMDQLLTRDELAW